MERWRGDYLVWGSIVIDCFRTVHHQSDRFLVADELTRPVQRIRQNWRTSPGRVPVACQHGTPSIADEAVCKHLRTTPECSEQRASSHLQPGASAR